MTDDEAETIALFREAGLLPGANESWPQHLKHGAGPTVETATANSKPTPARTSANAGHGGSTTGTGMTMGDDRPSVYYEDGIWVYRASAVGRCARELWAHRAGLQPEAHPDWLEEKFKAGNVGEPVIIAAVEKELGEIVTDQQLTVELPVGKTMLVRGHIDGVCGNVLVEAKTMQEKLYNTKWLRGGLKAYPAYSAQVAVYCAALGLDGVQVAIGVKGEDETVKKTKLFYYAADALPVTVKDVKKKLMKLGRMDDMPACDVDQFPCPFVYLHDEKPVMVSTSEMLAKYAAELYDTRAAKKTADERIKELTRKISAELDEAEVDGKVRAGRWEITDVHKTNLGRVDYGRMEEDGVDVAKYRGKPTETRYQTVKEVKDA